MKFLISILLLTAMHFGNLFAELHLPVQFSSNMVLQREKPVQIWGTATAGQKVTVRLGRQKVTTTADQAGHWQTTLRAMPANLQPQTMTVQSGRDKVEFHNILVGEVWLAGGQSNMEFNMGPAWRSGRTNKVDKPARGENYQQQELDKASCPLMRVLMVEKKTKTDTLPSTGWAEINATTLPPVSAVGYFFAKNLIDSLNVPVGIIVSCWGGSRIESWTPEEAYTTDSLLSPKVQNHTFHDGQKIGDMYGSMIRPLIPYTMRGFIWYQGESDLTAALTDLYPHMEQVMVRAWRNAWDDQQMPFYCVQLAPHSYSARRTDAVHLTWTSLPEFRQKQKEALALIPYSGMVITTDLCDNVKDIHPTYKWEVGRRLACQALRDCFGRSDIHHDGPQLLRAYIENGEVILEFDRQLLTTDGKAPGCFTLGAPNHRFYPPTKINVQGNRITMSTNRFKSPIAVRHAWDEDYVTNLCDEQLWPAEQFEIKL